jgi:hypothetical protein
VLPQQGAGFVARLAKNPLSDGIGFGIMRMASQKEFKEVSESGRQHPREVPRITEVNTRPHIKQRRY